MKRFVQYMRNVQKKEFDIAEKENNVEIEIIKEDQFRHWDRSAFFYDEMRRSIELGDKYLVICCDY